MNTTALTQEDREKWRQILTTESSLRTMLTEATIKEDYERIRRDERYERLFEPAKWDVIIRVLAPPERLYDPKVRARGRTGAGLEASSTGSSFPCTYVEGGVNNLFSVPGRPCQRPALPPQG